MLRFAAFTALMVAAPAAFAQQSGTAADSSGMSSSGGSSMASLLSQGYEIKASVPSGTKFIIFMQKEKSAYACEFVTVTNSRCKTIN